MVVPSAAQNIDPSDCTARLKSDFSNCFKRIDELTGQLRLAAP